MFTNNFNAEHSIKKWAAIIQTGGNVFLVLCILAAFIILCVDAEYLWWISLIVLGDGVLTFFAARFYSTMIWGFGDVVGNTKKLAGGTAAPIDQYDETVLPEL